MAADNEHDEVVVIAPFVQVPAWIFSLGPQCFVVFASLASFANRKTKSGWPSVPRIAKRCHVSESTAHRSIKVLEEAGAVKITRRERKDGGSFVNLYDLSPAFHPGFGGAMDSDAMDDMPDEVFKPALERQQGGVSEGHPLSEGHRGGVSVTPELEVEELEGRSSTVPVVEGLELRSGKTGTPARASEGAREAQRLCDHLADKIAGLGLRRPTITKAWLDDARLLVDRDGVAPIEVVAAIDYATAHHFWHRNILSMAKLRKQFDRLRLESKAERAAPSPTKAYDAAMESLREMAESS